VATGGYKKWIWAQASYLGSGRPAINMNAEVAMSGLVRMSSSS
jgi:hypothetical protein